MLKEKKLCKPLGKDSLDDIRLGKEQRITNHKKRNSKIMLENVWNKFALIRLEKGENEAFTYIFKNSIIISLIKDIAYSFYVSWRKNSRLSLHDFESISYEKAWKIISDYTPHYQNWFLYEQLKNGIKQECIMLLRNEGLTVERRGHKNNSYHKSLNFNQQLLADSFCLEDTILLRYNLEQIIKTFTEDELKIYNLYLNANNIENVKLDDICLELNLKYRQQAKRILNRLKEKIKIGLYKYE